MSKTQDILPLDSEWSHKIDVDTLPDHPWRKIVEAGEQECRDLARRLGVKAIEALKADAMLQRSSGGKIHVTGTVQAKIIQPCVVTLVDTVQVIQESFEAWYADKAATISLTRVRHEKMSQLMDAEVPMLEEYDDPEPIVNGTIDLGELASQYLSLALNPYPRAEGVTAEAAAKIFEERGVAPESRNPFAGLKKWKEARGQIDK